MKPIDRLTNTISKVTRYTRGFTNTLKNLELVYKKEQTLLPMRNGDRKILFYGDGINEIEDELLLLITLNCLFTIKNDSIERIYQVHQDNWHPGRASFAAAMESQQFVLKFLTKAPILSVEINIIVQSLYKTPDEDGVINSIIEKIKSPYCTDLFRRIFDYKTNHKYYLMGFYLNTPQVYLKMPKNMYPSDYIYELLASESMRGLSMPHDGMSDPLAMMYAVINSQDSITYIPNMDAPDITDADIEDIGVFDLESMPSPTQMGGEDFGYDSGGSDYSFSKLNKRMSGVSEYGMPSTVGGVTDSAIILDSSGSMKAVDYAKMQTTFKRILQNYGSVNAFWCDTKVRKEILNTTSWKDVWQNRSGGGSTEMYRCIHEILGNPKFYYSNFIIITDGGTSFSDYKELKEKGINIMVYITSPGVTVPQEINHLVL